MNLTRNSYGGELSATKYLITDIDAHADIVLTDDNGLPNSFEYDIVNTLRDTFSYILLIRKKGSYSSRSLRLEMSRERYEEMTALPKYMRLPPEKLLLLDR